MDEVFKALADPSRRRLLDSLNARNGQSLRELCTGLAMARQSVSKHLAVLEEANLVTTVWHGREKLHYLNAAPINDINQRWINQYDQPRIDALADLKRALEEKPAMFTYTTYIRTTPKQLWQALTDPAFTRRYWGGLGFETDWKAGSTVTWVLDDGVKLVDDAQVILESDPYHRLSYTWHSFTPEWADHYGFSAEEVATWNSEGRSKVAFDIEDLGDQVKLTVIHDDLTPGGIVQEKISGGWPRVLADLKTLLETGSV